MATYDDFKWFIRFLHDLEYESGMPHHFEVQTESISGMLTLSEKGKEEVNWYLRSKHQFVEKFADEELFTLPIKTGLFGLKLNQTE